jgi:uncharacterized membrane protein YphA (DoxX/SURF4 family)
MTPTPAALPLEVESPASRPVEILPRRDLAELRYLLLLCQAASVVVTWPLWQARGMSMPNLPIFESHLPTWLNIDCGWLLLGSLLLVLVRPLWGMIVHSLVLLGAIALDQMRIQPEFVSLAILLWGTTGKSPTLLLARSHLVALWLFAGLHKLLSPDYWHDTGPQNFLDTFPALSPAVAQRLAVAMAATEMLLGILLLIPRTRRAGAWIAFALHAGILCSLVSLEWNQAVWPWNLALAFAGFGFCWNWRESPLATVRKVGWTWSFAAVIVLASPALFYCNLLDAYLCHCVYSSNTPSATYFHGIEEGESLSTRSFAQLNVPFPPAHRLYEQYFRNVAQPGDVLEIEDPRPWARRYGYSQRALESPLPLIAPAE